MAAKKTNSRKKIARKRGPISPSRGGQIEARGALKALPKGPNLPDTGQPGGGKGGVDITGTIPEDIRVDPDLTEGHPGDQPSGDSEIIPTERLMKGQATKPT
jgi:hypothetical protein